MKLTNARKSTEMMAIPGSNRPAVPQAKFLNKSDPGSRIKVSIYARQNPTAPGKSLSLLDELNSKLPAERHYLSGDEFNSTFGADPADVDKIAAWAKGSKLIRASSGVLSSGVRYALMSATEVTAGSETLKNLFSSSLMSINFSMGRLIA